MENCIVEYFGNTNFCHNFLQFINQLKALPSMNEFKHKEKDNAELYKLLRVYLRDSQNSRSYLGPKRNLRLIQNIKSTQKATWSDLTDIQEAKVLSEKTTSVNGDETAYVYYVVHKPDLENFRNSVLSFNIAPQNSLKNYFKKINYATSINEALKKDWKNVSEDLSISFLSALKEQLANDPNDMETDERQTGQ